MGCKQVDEEAACVSNTIQNMLNSQGSFTEKQMGKIRFQEIQGHVLEKVCKYFYYKLRYNDASESEQPDFPIDSSEALELLMAANFLDCVRSSTSSSLMQTSTAPPVRSLRLFSCSA